MKIDQFLDPIEEQVIDDLENKSFQFSAEGAEESDDEEIFEALPKISANDALEALYKLRLHEEQQVAGNQTLLRELLHHEQVLMERGRCRISIRRISGTSFIVNRDCIY
jgi:hypothetical protein